MLYLILTQETLTGFKWMGNRAKDLIDQGNTVLFAFEEAIGMHTNFYFFFHTYQYKKRVLFVNLF